MENDELKDALVSELKEQGLVTELNHVIYSFDFLFAEYGFIIQVKNNKIKLDLYGKYEYSTINIDPMPSKHLEFDIADPSFTFDKLIKILKDHMNG